MSSQPETFGRVFIINPFHEVAQLNTACFSSLDMKWYDITGDIHSKFKTYRYNPVSLGFTIENVNKLGEVETFTGQFQIPMPLGEISSPDLDYIGEVTEAEKNCARRVKLPSRSDPDDSILKVIEKSQVGAMFILMTPGQTIVRESDFFPNISLLVMFDDLADDKARNMNELFRGQSKFPRTLPYLHQVAVFRPIIDLFKGRTTSAVSNKLEVMGLLQELNLPAKIYTELNRYNNCFIKICNSIHNESLKLGSLDEAFPFFQSFLESMEAVMFQHCNEWCDRNDTKFLKETQVELCKVTISVTLAAEAIALARGIQLREEIRSSFLFHQFIHEAATHAGKINDLLSYNKELTEEKDCNNEIYMLHFINNWKLENALQKVLDDANESVRNLNEMGKLLLEIFVDDESLRTYIKIVKEVMCGHLQWCGYTKRYHPTLVYDCYVTE